MTRPTEVSAGRFFLLANFVPNMTAFVIPERGDQLNFAASHPLNAPCDEELKSTDPKVVSEYMKQHFKAFDLDWDEFGQRWVEQEWSGTGQVYCNFYHSTKLNALLLGDAAHATVPNLGQGMNTALADVKVLDDLLEQHDDEWDTVLPAFSNDRVKEGNALTDLSYNTFCISGAMQAEIMIRQTTRKFLNQWLPFWLVAEEPLWKIGFGKPLSKAYHEVNQLGYLKRARRINQDIKRNHFETQCGMVDPTSSSNVPSRWMILGGIVLAAVASVAYTY